MFALDMLTFSKNILLIAGETSGDILAAHLLKGLRAQGCDLPVWGIGGPQLHEQGMECIETIDALAVRGYAEVLGALPRLWHLRKHVLAQAASRKPSLCITVDAPDFNLACAAKMKALGVPTLHFISPSIWAWRRERMAKIKASIDHMLCVFPFEAPLYQAAGVASTYVGHPMAQTIALEPDKRAARKKLGLAHDAKVIGLLPGSRVAEVKHILPRILAAAVIMQRRNPALKFVLPMASKALATHIQACMTDADVHALNIQCLSGQASCVFAAADLAIIASGTATLEAALYKLPMVITYVMPASSWAMMGHKGYQPWVGLPNILCESFVVPELLQSSATPQALAEAALKLLDDPTACEKIVQQFEVLHQSLRCDTQSLAARAVMRML